MNDIEQLNIKINVEKGITGIIESYKYNVNTNLTSKNEYLYAPTKYNLMNNARNNPELNNASLYSDRALLEDFLKKRKTTTTDNNIESNGKFILKLLFKKNSKFYIENLQFIIDKDLENKDISFNSASRKSRDVLTKDALTNKREEIRNKIEMPYKDASGKVDKIFITELDKRIRKEYEDFLNNSVEKNKYIQNYINNRVNKYNNFTISLVLKPSKETARYLKIKGFNISPEYLPVFGDCKSQKKQIYDNFLDLLCKPPKNRLAKYKPGPIPAFDPTKKHTRTHKKKPSKNSLAKYKPGPIPAFDPTKKHTRTHKKKGGNKNKKAKKTFSRKYIGHPSTDFPFCVNYNTKHRKNEDRKEVTIENLKKIKNDKKKYSWWRF